MQISCIRIEMAPSFKSVVTNADQHPILESYQEEAPFLKDADNLKFHKQYGKSYNIFKTCSVSTVGSI